MLVKKKEKRNFGKWRTATLVSVWVLFAIHFAHWKLNGTTLAPLELNEVLYTIHQGIITGGFLLMFAIMIATLIFGRFFCGWGCHILSLQDSCVWLMKKLKVKPRVIRSRVFLWIPFAAMFYLFVWPQISMLVHGVAVADLHIAEQENGGWTSFVTDDMWRNLPSANIALSTFFIVGFLLVYMLGSRSFCFYGCPYGALFGLADQVAPGRIVLTGNCVQCGICTANCGSDILIHKEVVKFGMVTSNRCFKDLDCVANCPEDALSFGFKTPPLFKKKFKLNQYKDRYNFTFFEDVLMAIVFVISILIYRALYDVIPFLMSVAISIATAYLFILFYRLIRKQSAKLRNITLKISGKITTKGYVFALFCLCYFAFTIHSGIVHYHHYTGQKVYKELLISLSGQDVDDSPSEARMVVLDEALYHFEKAQDLGIVNPLSLQKQIASIYLVKGQIDLAMPQLLQVIADNPNDLETRYRLGIIAENAGDIETAEKHFTQAIIDDVDMETNRDYELRSMAHLHLSKITDGNGVKKASKHHLVSAIKDDPNNFEANLAIGVMYLNSGMPEKAVDYMENAAESNPNSIVIHNNLSAIYSKMKQAKKAIPHYTKLLELQADNPMTYYNLGMSQYSIGQYSEARKNLLHALELNPSHKNARVGLNLTNKAIRNKQ